MCQLARHQSAGFKIHPETMVHRQRRSSRSHTVVYGSEGDDSSAHYPSLKVGIAGAGAIAFGTASLLSSFGHDASIWSPSGAGTSELVDEEGTSQIQSTGAIEQIVNVRVAHSPNDLVRSNDNVLVLALPVNGHKSVMEQLAPEIVQFIMDQQLTPSKPTNPMMHVIISSHASLGAVYLMQLLREEQRRYVDSVAKGSQASSINLEDWIRITAWGTTAITARKTSGTSVNVLTKRKAVDICTVPSNPGGDDGEDSTIDSFYNLTELLSDGRALCTLLFGQRFVRRRGGLLAISLSNLNPQNHLGIVLGNMSRMDPPPPPPPLDPLSTKPLPDTSLEKWWQGKCITPNVGRLMEALDRERIDIAMALNIDVRTIFEHFSWSFNVPLETPVINARDGLATKAMRPLTVSEMNQQMHYYAKTDVLGPSVPDSRYVLEDVPYGLVLTVILGRLLNRPAVLHESGIMILSAMYGRDFMAENELLQGLGLIGNDLPSLADWKEMAHSGLFKREES